MPLDDTHNHGGGGGGSPCFHCTVMKFIAETLHTGQFHRELPSNMRRAQVIADLEQVLCDVVLSFPDELEQEAIIQAIRITLPATFAHRKGVRPSDWRPGNGR